MSNCDLALDFSEITLAKAAEPTSFFSLTVPLDGAKTL